MKVTASAADNTITRVVRLVEEAQESKAPTERFIDRFSTYYTPAVMAVAALVAVVPPLALGSGWSAWIYKGLAVLLIGCPCALVISTPAAIAAALSAGARCGLLMKGGAVLKQIGRTKAIALDKTGTLTEGRPRVTDIVPLARSERQVLSLAAALETGSSHPLASAILERAKAAGAPVPPAADASALSGRGVTGRVGGEAVFLGSPAESAARVPLAEDQRRRVETLQAEGKTVSVLLAGSDVAGLIAMRDEPRDDAKAGIDALRRAGVEPVMLTGDNRATAEAVGRALGLPVHAELLPQDKLRIVCEMQIGGARVGKVGDGINDAPALAAADVGIAMGGGTDVALETADAAVLHGRVLDLARMISLSRRTMGNVSIGVESWVLPHLACCRMAAGNDDEHIAGKHLHLVFHVQAPPTPDPSGPHCRAGPAHTRPRHPRAEAALCPDCGALSHRVHSRYERQLFDPTWQGRPVALRVQARRFRCLAPSCPRQTFAERLTGVAAPAARRTERLARCSAVSGWRSAAVPDSVSLSAWPCR